MTAPLMPAPLGRRVVGASQVVTTAPAHCYRVLMRDTRGGIWTPIIVATTPQEAEERAVTLMGHKVVHSVALHPSNSDHTETAASLPDRRRAA